MIVGFNILSEIQYMKQDTSRDIAAYEHCNLQAILHLHVVVYHTAEILAVKILMVDMSVDDQSAKVLSAYIFFTSIIHCSIAMNSRDRYKIIGLCKISQSIKNLVVVFALKKH